MPRLRRLTYWVAECMVDSDCYSVRERTRRECKDELDERGNHERYGPIHKVTVQFEDAFDLLHQCMSEGRVYEGID